MEKNLTFPSCSTKYPSSFTSCERMSICKPLLSRKAAVTSGPNACPTPRFDGERPMKGEGSLHSKSLISPLSGGYKNKKKKIIIALHLVRYCVIR